mmetsp:Transcript_22672/g.68263  ORF Transcript_22672/g.68263 Transcript_22672/m.68263 type:complete len:307 (-) Transcript_22672:1047-1967(-)
MERRRHCGVRRLVDQVDVLARPVEPLASVAAVVVQLGPERLVQQHPAEARAPPGRRVVEPEPRRVPPLVRPDRVPHELRLVPEKLALHRGANIVLGKLAVRGTLDARVGGVDKDWRERRSVDTFGACHEARVWQPGQLNQRRKDVDHLRKHVRLAADRRCHPRRPNDKRDVDPELKVRHLGPRVVLAQLVPVVAKHDDNGRFCEAEGVQRVQDHPDVVVGVRNGGVVGPAVHVQPRHVDGAIEGGVFVHPRHVGVRVPRHHRHPNRRKRIVRQRHRRRIRQPVEELLRRIVRRVRLVKAASDEEGP